MAKERKQLRRASPGVLTARRFFRNKLAVTGLVILSAMFLFSFLGGALSPYGQDQVFYRDELQRKEYAGVQENTGLRFTAAPGENADPAVQARFLLLCGKDRFFTQADTIYEIESLGSSLYALRSADRIFGIAHTEILTPVQSFDLTLEALKAYANGSRQFKADGVEYTLRDGSVLRDGQEICTVSNLVIRPKIEGTQISADFRNQVADCLARGGGEFTADGQLYQMHYDPAAGVWSVREQTKTRVWDSYAAPSSAHPLGTDKNGMDMLTRLMYGGRVSLVIGFLVVAIAATLGVIFGGVSGYFGGWVDELVMRLVDIFYCIPSTPLLIILGAAMDGMRVDPQIRMLFLMLILGLLGWPSIARLVRGQILSLREQEFMTAAEAGGIRVHKRIFRHLLPNVIPQLIVTCTLSLGSTILTEATLSFLGLGVKFPFASWGNIMNDVSNSHVLTSYWFIWIPAGVCLMLAVLGFNFVGDGLRDAFDPKMKR